MPVRLKSHPGAIVTLYLVGCLCRDIQTWECFRLSHLYCYSASGCVNSLVGVGGYAFGVVFRTCSCMLMSSDTYIPYSDPWHHMYDIYIYDPAEHCTTLHQSCLCKFSSLFFLPFHHSFASNVFSAWIRVVHFLAWQICTTVKFHPQSSSRISNLLHWYPSWLLCTPSARRQTTQVQSVS